MPQALTDDEIEETIEAFVLAAALAGAAGYDGDEVMGSEGYLINEFIAPATNHRTDRWGGSFENRVRFPLEIVRRVRERVSPDLILIYRLSMLDLVPDGSALDEVVTLAKAVEAAGATIINTGTGWHEARPPNAATTSRCSTPTTRSAASSTSPGGSRASGHLALTDRTAITWSG